MRITLSSRAKKELKKIQKIDQISLVKKLKSLTDPSLQKKGEKLTGYSDMFRVRVGDYRIVYKEMKGEVYIVLIGHRKDIYQLLRQFFN
ncbi:hypothetical protein A3D80_01245 [Candidatus Roizmanbacteria bacterium RIFCSPHIGHO2_02_FULL_40_13b]|uniref:Addiction module toxin RelE n=1 Tax=Candidatus Roizmanbacteria bacterium RIFCSPHIGHO2_01_FULL_39_24 TaxID=1802032 RepID=A0A1F7GIS6_9BACT|nr:MAG: hypothetical protein A2799_01185 [Candidatus Roizmanbacteria bacterium RIFCSPHIGHO2_01_FULL_39_24]OGK26149.1 MAG: hypothetical protein A3D80_01245 [Candidatus Roizmanbacteria bacterium RIFCSPHIGHO2_02_FULL_40_13b]OGK49126.1 MAG: hypothetical protein A3A56_00770 [Candidatus Roizmanbacteria bacterium RIFCSPLOWO2_01_FULL_40_32]OGK57341.1 MAG: hypothetical protein A3H83_00980 [Candidatus Roizmanbacteria bacterium RIFCSPLOWO2_02_FULL_39_8]